MLDFLKNTPQTTGAEVVMIETPDVARMSVSNRIRHFKEQMPNASAKEIAKAAGTTSAYVYVVLNAKAKPEKKPKKKQETLVAPKHKTDGFAIGVTQPHYWVISALASGRKTSRTAVLQVIIDQYIRDVLTEVNSNGASV